MSRILCALTISALLTPIPAAEAMNRVTRNYPGGNRIIDDTINATWPSHLRDAAKDVAWCESTGKPTARNGQFRGLFQIGRNEWARYGAGNIFDPIDNASAAYRYFRAAGGFGPWECQPA